MTIFYCGIHRLSIAGELDKCMVSANLHALKNRVSDFKVNDWILDSGAFTEISTYGYFRTSIAEYARQVNRWSKCGNLQAAVSQDYMCEPFILNKTGLTVYEHQRLTIERYEKLKDIAIVYIMPVLQGYQPQEYVNHIKQYGNRLNFGMWVGVGSVCKRNSNPSVIIEVLEAIKVERPDLKLHGFGLKTTALLSSYIASMLYSADSMAWSYAARREGRNGNDAIEAINYTNRINHNMGKRATQLSLPKSKETR